MTPDVFYVIDYVNPAADGQVHFAVAMLDGDASLKKALGHWQLGHPHLQIDVEKKYPRFATKPEAEAHARELGAQTQAANPGRVPAEEQFPPGEANRHLEIGKPGAL